VATRGSVGIVGVAAVAGAASSSPGAPDPRPKRSMTRRVTSGESSASPRAMTCTASTSDSGDALFSTKPLAPASSAVKR
jgi:hypothetical protein